jgi:hypothetical protein
MEFPIPAAYTRTQNFASYAELNTAICTADSGKFCRSGNEIYIEDVCNNYAMLPATVQ